MDKFYFKDGKIYVENDVELIELTLDDLLKETNRLAKKEVMMEKALEFACVDLSLYEDITTPKQKMNCYKIDAHKQLFGGNDNG